MDAMNQSLDSALLAAASGDGTSPGRDMVPLQQVKTSYTTAIAVQQPRDLQKVSNKLLAESRMAGESFYYGWGSGKDRIEGPSIGLANAAARCFGNSAVDMLPMQETPDAWVMTAAFIDLETGFTITRQFRQSKKSVIYGKHDEERKNDMRFQIGQSKAIRNVVLNALPQWLIDRAVEAAKLGVKERIEQYVKANGIAAAVELVLRGLAKHGITEVLVLGKMAVAKPEALDIDHLVMLRGDLHALDNGQEHANVLFPGLDGGTGTNASRSALNDKLADEAAPKPEAKKAAKPKSPPADPNEPSEEELIAAGIKTGPA